MKKKILNTDDNDTLNPMADVRNYGAGAETGVHLEETETAADNDDDDNDSPEETANDDLLKVDKPLPGEIANPEEQEDADEMA